MRFLSNSEKKELNLSLPKGYMLDKKDEVKEHEGILYKNNQKYLLTFDGKYFPHLKTFPKEQYKGVYVDRGALPFITKGADLMRPGIRSFDEPFEKDETIFVGDEQTKKVVAIGIAMDTSEKMKAQEKGKCVKIIHFVGDLKY
jgi:PUA domain protein